MVAANRECSGLEIDKNLQTNAQIQDCAKECEGVSSMFIFTHHHNHCFCETSATGITCDMIDLQDYDLYKYGIYNRYKYILKAPRN